MSTPSDVPVGLSAQSVSLHGRLFAIQTFHFEPLRNTSFQTAPTSAPQVWCELASG
jgi:hypothetical protein